MPNTLTSFVDKILAAGLMALRQQAVMPRLVNRRYEMMAGQKGTSIDVPIPSAIAAVQVAPANTPPVTTDIVTTSVSIPMNQWWEAPFYLTDKEVMEVDQGIVPSQASEAIKSLANKVDISIFAEAELAVFGMAGVPGTTPFAVDPTEYLDARKILNKQLAPMDDRAVVIDVDAEAKALNLRAFQDAAFRGDTGGIINGQIGTKLGATWVMDQNIQTHTSGTGANGTTTAAGFAIGTTSVVLAAAGTGTILAGDVVTFAGDAQTYKVTTGVASLAAGGTLVIYPGLQRAIPAIATAITVKGAGASYVMNLNFHRDAFALASRPLDSQDFFGMGNFRSAPDPISGLVLRLEVTREHKRTRLSYDILWGVKCVRPELACIIAG